MVVPIDKATLDEATGSDRRQLQKHLIGQICETLWTPERLAEDEKGGSNRVGHFIASGHQAGR